MKILGIETSTYFAGVAISDGEKVLAEMTFEKGMRGSKELAPAVQETCKTVGIPLSEIDRIACDIGPGSYTGLRTGLAFAKGLAYALKKELVGVASLDAMAQNHSSLITHHSPLFLCPIIDAKWAQVYAAIYEQKNGEVRRKGDLLAIAPDKFAEMIPDGATIFGDGVERYSETFSRFKVADKSVWFPRPSVVALLGADAKPEDPFTITPLYLRPTEAEVKLKSMEIK